MKKWLIFVGLLLISDLIIRAQTPAQPWQVGVPTAATHTACTVTVGLTQMCLASDGLWVSVNGVAYIQVQTGTPVAPPVTSVNGKTGAVVLAIQ